MGAKILATEGNLVPTGARAADEPRGDAPQSSADHVDWQTAMRRAIRSEAALRQAVGIAARGTDCDLPPSASRDTGFPTFVPLEYLSRIRHGDPNDPLLRQVLIRNEEFETRAGFVADAVGDLDALATEGLLHKYHGRALLVTTGACGIHCRYCFRREFPYQRAGSRSRRWKPSLTYLRKRHDVEEVLLSGGDPLTVNDRELSELISEIEDIPHVRRLRIHSRMPVVIPQRVTEALVTRLAASRLTVWVVIHANHPRELDAQVLEHLSTLIDRGIPVLNQAVLLRGVNDRVETLFELCRTLINHRIQPYYLHQLDRVRGAGHFEVPIAEGLRIMEQLREQLPGYAVPQYVAERTGEPSKSPISRNGPVSPESD